VSAPGLRDRYTEFHSRAIHRLQRRLPHRITPCKAGHPSSNRCVSVCLSKYVISDEMKGDSTGTISRVKSVGYCVPEELNKSWTSTSTPGVAANANPTIDAKGNRSIVVCRRMTDVDGAMHLFDVTISPVDVGGKFASTRVVCPLAIGPCPPPISKPH